MKAFHFLARYGSLALAAAGILAAGSPVLAATYATGARLAYIGYAAVALRREERRQDVRGKARRFEAFRGWKSILSYHDAFGLLLLAWLTRGSLPLEGAPWVTEGAGLVLVGAGVKAWAVASLGWRSYYWGDFFFPPTSTGPCRRGPYRFLRHPMYTLGYLQVYGVPLVLGSGPGLLLGLFMHATIWVFHGWVERPHVRRLFGPAQEGLPSA